MEIDFYTETWVSLRSLGDALPLKAFTRFSRFILRLFSTDRENQVMAAVVGQMRLLEMIESKWRRANYL